MDASKVDTYIMANQKYLPTEKIIYVKEKLLAADEQKFNLLTTIEFKDPTTLLLVSIFLGSLGIDRFMLGDIGMGILKLLTLGVCGVLTIIDWFTIQKKAKEYKDVFFDLANDIYIPDDDYDLYGVEIKPKLVELEDDGQNEHDVAFDGIKDVIIQGIRNAKYTIWVAVAWFSDRDIFQELLAKKKQGISIRIITSNEKSNMTLMSELESNFEVVKVPLKGAYLSNRLHDKFCIIDFEFVMHGSYNWSKAAQYNDETLATALDRDFVKKFADEFMRLYNNHNE